MNQFAKVITEMTVLFHFEQKGINAHVAKGSFTFETPEQAQKFKETIVNKEGYTNIRII
jgi:hypothetical protein